MHVLEATGEAEFHQVEGSLLCLTGFVLEPEQSFDKHCFLLNVLKCALDYGFHFYIKELLLLLPQNYYTDTSFTDPSELTNAKF